MLFNFVVKINAIKTSNLILKKNLDNSSSTSQLKRLVGNIATEIVFLRDEIKNKNNTINKLLGNFNKSQNLSYNEGNKFFSSSEKVLISHDSDTL